MNKRSSDTISSVAFLVAFAMIIAGLFLPIILIEGKQHRLFNMEGSIEADGAAPFKAELHDGEIETEYDAYTDIRAGIMLWELSDDKREREPFSYEIGLDDAVKNLMNCIERVDGGLLPELKNAEGTLSANYIATSGAQEIDVKYKGVEVGGITLPYDMGRWKVTLSAEDGSRVTGELDAQMGRVYSMAFYLPAKPGMSFSANNMLVAFAAYHGIFDSSEELRYDSEALKLSCGELTFYCDMRQDEKAYELHFGIRLEKAEENAG